MAGKTPTEKSELGARPEGWARVVLAEMGERHLGRETGAPKAATQRMYTQNSRFSKMSGAESSWGLWEIKLEPQCEAFNTSPSLFLSLTPSTVHSTMLEDRRRKTVVFVRH